MNRDLLPSLINKHLTGNKLLVVLSQCTWPGASKQIATIYAKRVWGWKKNFHHGIMTFAIFVDQIWSCSIDTYSNMATVCLFVCFNLTAVVVVDVFFLGGRGVPQVWLYLVLDSYWLDWICWQRKNITIHYSLLT